MAFADVWYVDKHNTSGVEDGTSWPTAFTTIQTAVDAASAAGGGEVWVAEGTYLESITLFSSVWLYGGFDGTETFLSERDPLGNVTTIGASAADAGGSAEHAAIVDSMSDARFDGFTITGDSAASGNGQDAITDAAIASATAFSRSTASDDDTATSNIAAASAQDEKGPEKSGNTGNTDNSSKKPSSGSVGEGNTVVGIEGGNGKDVIVNNDDLIVSSSDSGEANISLTLTGTEQADETTALTSGAVAIDSGNGPDKITNTKKGTITAIATSELTNVDITMDLAEFSYGNASSSIDSTAVGIIAGNGSDKITNAKGGEIAAEATSKLTDLDFELNLKLADFSHADAVPILNSTAVGITGGNGKDTVDNA